MTTESGQIVFAVLSGLLCLPLGLVIFRLLTVEVEAESAVILRRFGKISKILREPGLHFWTEKIAPWTNVKRVSLKRDFRLYEEIHVNDSRGTTMVIDLWTEFRVVSPEKALFQVEDWEGALRSLLTNTATSILGTFEFAQILGDRDKLGTTLREDIREETSRWGLEIDLVFVSKLSVLPDVARQLFDTVAARLEKAKADIEEAGRLEAALLEAETSASIAGLVAQAKGQYALGVGHAYHKLANSREVLGAYKELYELSLVKPHRTVAFIGFSDGETTAMEAAMTVPPSLDGAVAHEGDHAPRHSF